MSKSLSMTPLGEVLIKSNDWIDLDPYEMYRQVTVRLWGKGVSQRREATGADIAAAKGLVIHSNQFILSRIDARNGAFGIVPDSLDGAIVSNDFPVFSLNPHRIIPSFLGWMSKTGRFVDLCKAASEGITNRARLKEDRFLAMTIPLPPLSEQRRIVAQIEELATQIEEARRLRQGSEDATKRLWAAGATQILQTIPTASWQRVGDVVVVLGGGTPSKTNPEFWNGTVPWVCPRDMKQREIYDSIDRITEAAVDNSSAKLISPGAVLVVVRGMILAHTFPTAVLHVPATINQDMKALIPKNGLLPKYLCAVLWGLNSDIVALVERSGHDTRKLVTEKLMDFRLPIPSVDQQQNIFAVLERLQMRLVTSRQIQTDVTVELDTMLPSVLDKAFSGNL